MDNIPVWLLLVCSVPVLFVGLGLVSAWAANCVHDQGTRQRWREEAARSYTEPYSMHEPDPWIAARDDGLYQNRGELLTRMCRKARAERYVKQLEDRR